MSQLEIYRILEELGGSATTAQVAKRAREKFPGYSLHEYTRKRLDALKKWGYVDTADGKTWTIKERYKA